MKGIIHISATFFVVAQTNMPNSFSGEAADRIA